MIMIVMVHMKFVVVAEWQGYLISQFTTALSDRSFGNSAMQSATSTAAAL